MANDIRGKVWYIIVVIEVVMVNATDYFIVFGALVWIYAIFRVIIWMEFSARVDFQKRPPSEPSGIQNHPIDTSRLAHRLEDVRRDYAAEARTHVHSPNKPLLVEERRAEIAKLAFFSKTTDVRAGSRHRTNKGPCRY